jgi:2-keto-4-pentenoate hydratase/2-oxohepta-3-ene-1,7-dioic acid hydratase in catechol pathway
MKLITFGPPKAEQPGVMADDGTILPLALVLDDYGVPPSDMNAVLGALPLLKPAIEKALASGKNRISADGVRIGPPVPRPRKLLLVGGNYWSHVMEMKHLTGGVPPSPPAIHLKPNTIVVGPNDTVIKPPEAEKLDYEAELGVVIGLGGRRIKKEDALKHVAGYMNVDDTGDRLIQLGKDKGSRNPTRGKGFETWCPSGPYLVTADEIPDPGNLRLRKWVNGELRQDCNTNDMVLGVAELIEDISSVMHLLPGDTFLTGTGTGCGAAQDPPNFLKDGDIIKQEIDGDGVSLGVMENPIADEVME